MFKTHPRIYPGTDILFCNNTQTLSEVPFFLNILQCQGLGTKKIVDQSSKFNCSSFAKKSLKNQMRTYYYHRTSVFKRDIWLWSFMLLAKIRDFQKNIGIIYRLKQICHFIILNSSFEFLRIFCYCFAAVLSFFLSLRKFQTFKFKIVIWHFFEPHQIF